MPTALELVADARKELESLDTRITEARASKVEMSRLIARLIDERKPLARIVSAAKGRSKGNGDEPDTAE